MRTLAPVALFFFAVINLLGCAEEKVPVAAAPPTPSDLGIRRTPAPPMPSDLSPASARVYDLASLKRVTLRIAGKPFRMWVMDNPGKRQEGMMFLTPREVAADQGMVFVFPTTQKDDGSTGFWMRNTSLPLDIVYLSPQGRVTSIGEGVPFNETSVRPKGDYRWVVELRRGSAKRNGLKVGDAIPGIAALQADT